MNTFTEALAARGCAADRQGKMDLYAWLLEGRAIQDVWIVPPRGERTDDAAKNVEYYGTTLRVYDPRLDAWHIRWTDPVSGIQLSQIGRKDAGGIVQDGKLDDGRL